MSNAIDRAVSSIGLSRVMTLANSALPDAPVVPDTPRDSLVDRARRAIASTRRLVSSPAPDLPDGSVLAGSSS